LQLTVLEFFLFSLSDGCYERRVLHVILESTTSP